MSDRSRLIVLALPSALSREGLRAHFASINLPLTDVRLLANKAGNSRRVGFIGFQNNADAQQAKEWFDGTWVAGSRIKVDFAETAVATNQLHPSPPSQFANAKPGVNGKISSGDMATLSTPSVPGSSQSKRSVVVDEESDAEYLAKRMKRQIGSAGESVDESHVGGSLEAITPALSHTQEPIASTSTSIHTQEEPGRLFLRNLAFTTSRQEVLDVFSCFGEITEVHMPQETGKGNKGIAFIHFLNPQHASAARQAMDGKALSGRLLHILPASSRLGDSSTSSSTCQIDHPRTFAQQRKAKLSRQADQTFNWASLYMNSDAVVASLASRHGSSKAEILDATDSSAAARLALAESYIIQETKDYFSSNGVNIEAFESVGSRSRTTLLLKNLPAGSTAATVQSLLESVKGMGRILVPPSGTLALVELGDPATATKAATSLAYRKLGNSVIYVERAPSGLWKDLGKPYDIQKPDTPDMPRDQSSGTPSESDSQSHSLFVTKLPPNTSAATFKSLFQNLPGFAYANLLHRQTVGDTSRGGPPSGFVGFSSPEDAQRAKKIMNGHVLDGHMVSVSESKGAPRDAPLEAKQNSGKLLIKNLPFETNKQELRGVLGAYGKIISLRLPLNAQGRPRGFAFVNFGTPQEAMAARKGLTHTHILGRHMIVEEAQ